MATIPKDLIEILDMPAPKVKANTIVNLLDGGKTETTIKSDSIKKTEYADFKYRVHNTVFVDFYTFLETNRGVPLVLDNDGVTPFPRSSENNNVLIERIGEFTRTKFAYWEGKVTYKFVSEV